MLNLRFMAIAPSKKRRAIFGSLLWALFCLNVAAQTPSRISGPLPSGWQRLASGFFWLPATQRTGGEANLGYLATADGGVLIDTGPSEAFASRALVGSKRPIAAAFNTHAHPENVLGNRALGEVKIYASPITAQLMRERCGECRTNFATRHGLQNDTPTVFPNRPLAAFERLVVGGRALTTLSFAAGHVPGNTVVFDETSRALFAGGLVVNRHIPDMSEADPEAWLAALGQLQRLNPRAVVPDRGAAGGRHLIGATARYVQAVHEAVTQAFSEGRDLTELTIDNGFGEFARWRGYAERHGANLRAVFLRYERKLL